MRLLAIDPGSQQSGWLILDTESWLPLAFGKDANDAVLRMCWAGEAMRAGRSVAWSAAVIEWMAPRGMPTSAEEMETCWWHGRFREALGNREGKLADLDDEPVVHRILRARVQKHISGPGASDARIRAALIDRYGGIGGKRAAVGLKASPGPLYGIANDAWAALALAVTQMDAMRGLVAKLEAFA